MISNIYKQGYTITLMHGSQVYADSTTYTVSTSSQAPATTAANRGTIVPKNGVIRRVELNWIATVNGTTEAITCNLLVNGSSVATLSEAIVLDGALRNYSITGLTNQVVAGDEVKIQVVVPSMTTNPTTGFSAQILIDG